MSPGSQFLQAGLFTIAPLYISDHLSTRQKHALSSLETDRFIHSFNKYLSMQYVPDIVINAKDGMVKKKQTWYLLLWSLHSSKNLDLKRRILKSKYLPPYLYIYLKKKSHKFHNGQICFNQLKQGCSNLSALYFLFYLFMYLF